MTDPTPATHSTRSILAAAGVAFLLGTTSLLAAPLRDRWPVDPTQESVLAWAGGGVIAAAALACAILVFLLARRRTRLLEPTSKWLLLIALGILPGFVVLGTNSIVLSTSKSATACASCHVMQPFLDDMRDPASDKLAAVHFKNRFIPENQCYTCHSTYGIYGDIQAKAKGVGHLVKYYSGRYERPIRHSGPYDLAQCLKCHGASARFLAAEPHRADDFWPDLEAGRASCFDCHGRAHPEFKK